MGGYNPRTPDIEGSEFQPTSWRKANLNSPIKGIAQRIRPGAVTISRLHPLLRAVEGNPGLGLEVLTTLEPTITETVHLPGTDTGATTTGWADQAAAAVNFGDVDAEYYDGTNYATNSAALSAAGSLDLLFRGDDAGDLGTDRVLSVKVGAVLRLSGMTGNAREIDVAARLVLNGDTYRAGAKRSAQRSTYERRAGLGVWYLNPSTGLPWVTADVDDILDAADADTFGIRVKGKLAAGGLRVGGLFLTIAHCAENRIGYVYTGGQVRAGWLEQVLTGTSAASADTFYWVHVFALNGSAEDYLQTAILDDPALLVDDDPAGTGDPRQVVRTTLSGPGGVPVETVEKPGQMIPILVEAGGTIQASSQAYSDLSELTFSLSGLDLDVGQQITTPNPAETFAGVQLPVGWQDPRRRPNRPLKVEVRTGAGAETGGGTLKATATLLPEASSAAVLQRLVPFDAPFAAATSTKHHVLVYSRASNGRGWRIPRLDARSDLVTTAGGTTTTEVQDATQGGVTDSYEIGGVASDRYDLPVALFAAPDGPTGLTAVAFAGQHLLFPPGVFLTWDPSGLAGDFEAYRVYRRPARAQVAPWTLIAEIAPRASQDPAEYEAAHTAFRDIEAGWAARLASSGRGTGPFDDGWDYAVTTLNSDNGLESDRADTVVTGVTVPAGTSPWLTSNAAPWLSFPLESAGRMASAPVDRTRVHEVAGRDDAVTRTRAERAVRRWRLGWRHIGWRSEDAARWPAAAARSGRRMALLGGRGDRALGTITPVSITHELGPILPADAELVVNGADSIVAGYNIPGGVLLDGTDDFIAVADADDLDPDGGDFTVVAAARIPDSAEEVLASKGFAPSSLVFDAVLRLQAGEVDPDTYQTGDPWPNLGTLGSAHDAQVPTTGDISTPDLIAAGETNGPGFQVGTGGTGSSFFGWRIPHHASLDIPNSGGVTYTIDYTPVNHTDPSYKIAQKYPASSLPLSGEGWVIEHVDDTGGGPGSGGLLTAAYDGTNFYAVIENPNIANRQRITARWDRTTDEVTFFRNGVEIGTRDDISAMGDVTTTADLKLGQDNIYHNVLVHDRALTDDEVEELHTALAPTGTGWLITTSNAGQLQFVVQGEARFALATSTSTRWFGGDVVVVGADSDGSTLRMFLNGELDTTDTGPAHGDLANVSSLIVGAVVRSTGTLANHMAADHQAIAYWPRRLTAGEHEAAARWLLGHHGYRMPAGASLFHDVRDDRCWDASGTTIADLSGNGHDATLVGDPLIHGRPWPLDDLEDP